MVNVDTALSVAIWATGIGMTAVGIEMSYIPPEKPAARWVHRVIFIVLGIVFIGANLWQSSRLQTQKDAEIKERHEVEVRNEGNMRYMQGQLDTTDKLLGVLATNSDPKQIVGALRDSMPKWKPNAEAGAVSNFSNAQVVDGAHDLSRRLRQLDQQQSKKVNTITDRLMRQIMSNGSDQKVIEETQREMTKQINDVSLETEGLFGPLRAESRNMVNLLQNRVPEPQPRPIEIVQVALSMNLAGPDPIGQVADYIDQLANLVPVKR